MTTKICGYSYLWQNLRPLNFNYGTNEFCLFTFFPPFSQSECCFQWEIQWQKKKIIKNKSQAGLPELGDAPTQFTQRATVQRPQLPAPAPGCYKHGLLPHHYSTIFFFVLCNCLCSCCFTVTAGLRCSFPCLSSLLLSSVSVSCCPGFLHLTCEGDPSRASPGSAATATSPKGRQTQGPSIQCDGTSLGLCCKVPTESFPAISPISKLACTCAGTARASRAAGGCRGLRWGRSELWFKNAWNKTCHVFTCWQKSFQTYLSMANGTADKRQKGRGGKRDSKATIKHLCNFCLFWSLAFNNISQNPPNMSECKSLKNIRRTLVMGKSVMVAIVRRLAQPWASHLVCTSFSRSTHSPCPSSHCY